MRRKVDLALSLNPSSRFRDLLLTPFMTGITGIVGGYMTMTAGLITGVTSIVARSSNTSPESTPTKSSSESRGKEGDRDKDKEKGKDKQRDQQQGRQNGHGAPSGSGGGGGRKSWEEPGAGRYQKQESRRERLKRVADTTLRALKRGSYEYRGETIYISQAVKQSVDATVFYSEDSLTLGEWKRQPRPFTQGGEEATFSILNVSTLDAAKILTNSYRFHAAKNGVAPPKTGVLNFASATQPGGGFMKGAEAQEESIARVSSLYPSLTSKEGKRLYDAQGHSRSPFHTHSMVWSPGVVVFQNDYAETVQAYQIGVVSCAAVDARKLLEDKQSWQTGQAEIDIEAAMRERMGRILYLFEIQGVRNIVLGTFGTGVFKNKISEVARIWAELLVKKDSRFRYSFDRVIFAVTGDSTFAEFKGRFEGWTKQKETTRPATYLSPY